MGNCLIFSKQFRFEQNVSIFVSFKDSVPVLTDDMVTILDRKIYINIHPGLFWHPPTHNALIFIVIGEQNISVY